jgi:hypothetical protein
MDASLSGQPAFSEKFARAFNAGSRRILNARLTPMR